MNIDNTAIVGVTAGQFDLVHAGHIMMFKECKKYCSFLIVLLQKDASQTDIKYRGKRKHKPILSIKERKIILQGIKYIDQVIIYDSELNLYKKLKELKKEYKTELVRILGADWKDKKYTGEDLKIKTIFNTRNHNYSTSGLLTKIKKSYDV